ncbi:hypothetical protein VNO78_34361 [Psophocarpus tetragonolobus]|uniref:Uncharacterized protein n=1 Tax=Psophocarpus tetragonolobus TaxID=3891 RepID=A0AAN9NYZ9_PSOTE
MLSSQNPTISTLKISKRSPPGTTTSHCHTTTSLISSLILIHCRTSAPTLPPHLFAKRENLAKKMGVMLVVTVMIMLVLESQQVECAFAIPLNPCTLPECIARCKDILHEKFMSASCMTTGSKGSLFRWLHSFAERTKVSWIDQLKELLIA